MTSQKLIELKQAAQKAKDCGPNFRNHFLQSYFQLISTISPTEIIELVDELIAARNVIAEVASEQAPNMISMQYWEGHPIAAMHAVIADTTRCREHRLKFREN